MGQRRGMKQAVRVTLVAALLLLALGASLTKASPSPVLPAGTFLFKFGSDLTTDGKLNNPNGVAVDSLGNVYVADSNNYRIQKFTSEGVFLAKWGSRGSGDGQFGGPRGIAVDGLRNVYVAEFLNINRIQKFTSEGVFLAKWGSPGGGDGQFVFANGVAVDGSGNVYVADSLNYRVQVFASGEAPPAPTPTPTPVPGLGFWGLGALTVLLASALWLAQRRRRPLNI